MRGSDLVIVIVIIVRMMMSGPGAAEFRVGALSCASFAKNGFLRGVLYVEMLLPFPSYSKGHSMLGCSSSFRLRMLKQEWCGWKPLPHSPPLKYHIRV